MGNETGLTRQSESTRSSDCTFPDLPLGSYSLAVGYPGFATSKVSDVVVRPEQVYSLPVKLSITTTAQQVEVKVAAVSLDTESTASNSVVNDAAV